MKSPTTNGSTLHPSNNKKIPVWNILQRKEEARPSWTCSVCSYDFPTSFSRVLISRMSSKRQQGGHLRFGFEKRSMQNKDPPKDSITCEVSWRMTASFVIPTTVWESLNLLICNVISSFHFRKNVTTTAFGYKEQFHCWRLKPTHPTGDL